MLIKHLIQGPMSRGNSPCLSAVKASGPYLGGWGKHPKQLHATACFQCLLRGVARAVMNDVDAELQRRLATLRLFGQDHDSPTWPDCTGSPESSGVFFLRLWALKAITKEVLLSAGTVHLLCLLFSPIYSSSFYSERG